MNSTTKEMDAALEITARLMRRGDELTQKEIADICGCSRSLVHQIEKSALRKVRTRLRKEYGLNFEQFIRSRVMDIL